MTADPNSVTLHSWAKIPAEPLKGGMTRKLITGQSVMLAQIALKKGDDVPRHHHENEQLTYVLSGSLEFWLGDGDERNFVVCAGEVAVIPSNVAHRVLALEDSLTCDIFSPPRQDWLTGTDNYLRG